MHVNSVAHLLHNITIRERVHFKNIDEVIATIKQQQSKTDFNNAGLPSPPDPVITRWATWLRAALYYSENLLVPLNQQCKKRYQCGKIGAGLG